jgi:predicted Holliday junction resolvase-like endonuclease
MDIETRKKNLINWITSLHDEGMMKRLESIQQNGSEWSIEISEIEKKILQLAEADIEKGDLVANSKVMEQLAEYIAKRK